MPRLPKPSTLDLETLSSDERRARQAFIDRFLSEYELSQSDKIVLELAASEYILVLRSQEQQLRSGQIMAFSRQEPTAKLSRMLVMLGCTRRQRLDSRVTESEEEQEMRSLLMSLNKVPLPNGGSKFVVSNGRIDDASE